MSAPSKRPIREQYPPGWLGDCDFYRTLSTWQYDEIERLLAENQALRNLVAVLTVGTACAQAD